MKKQFFIIVAFILSMQYCFALESTKEITEIKSVSHQIQTNKLQNFADFTVEPSTIISTVTENESFLQVTSQFQFLTFKNNPNNFSNYLKITEEIYSSAYSQYTSTFYNFPIKFRKANIIFPFHYFW